MFSFYLNCSIHTACVALLWRLAQ